MSRQKLRVLTFSTLFPNRVQPAHGIFVWRRLKEVLATQRVEARVVAPVPWFPSSNRAFGRYSVYRAVPDREETEGTEVLHPRYLVIPKVGMRLAPFLLALGALPTLKRLQSGEFPFDLIDAHYYYPDGVAATMLGAWLHRPVVITARGTDISLLPRDPVARRLIIAAAKRAQATIAVCQALKDEMTALGVEEQRITVLRNGVDLEHFRPIDRIQARLALNLANRRWLLSVGLLIDRKGHDIAIRALAGAPEWSLIIVGEGPLRRPLYDLAIRCGVADRVHFAGLVSSGKLPTYYSAADALILASSREGWANVLLESMACGTPVIASNVWGTPEIVRSPAAGVLMRERTPEALLEALALLLRNYPAREDTRRYAESFDWGPTTQGQLRIFERLTGRAA